MIDGNRAFLYVWSDVFYKFFYLACNDDGYFSGFRATPLQDVDPNNLA